jgi:hypothetical protein
MKWKAAASLHSRAPFRDDIGEMERCRVAGRQFHQRWRFRDDIGEMESILHIRKAVRKFSFATTLVKWKDGLAGSAKVFRVVFRDDIGEMES